jgi:ribosomal protein L44E
MRVVLFCRECRKFADHEVEADEKKYTYKCLSCGKVSYVSRQSI